MKTYNSKVQKLKHPIMHHLKILLHACLVLGQMVTQYFLPNLFSGKKIALFPGQ